MKKYCIYHVLNNETHGGYSKEDLFKILYKNFSYHIESYRNYIGHNINDTNSKYLKSNRQFSIYDYKVKIPSGEYRQVSFIIYDDLGRVIHIDEIIENVKNYEKIGHNFYKRKIEEHSYIFRHDPVPHVHKDKNCSYYRHYKTTNEKRFSCDCEIKQYIRPKRRYKNLMDGGLNDDTISSIKDRSWKQSTKKRKQGMKSLKN